MSGGAFDYLYGKFDDAPHVGELESMADWLRDRELPMAASKLRAAAIRIRAAFEDAAELSELMREVEWCASCDTSQTSVDIFCAKKFRDKPPRQRLLAAMNRANQNAQRGGVDAKHWSDEVEAIKAVLGEP